MAIKLDIDPDAFLDFVAPAVTAYRMALSGKEADIFNLFNKVSKVHVRLRGMEPEEAYKAYQGLDPWVQTQLKETYNLGDVPYVSKPENPALRAAKMYGQLAMSPFKFAAQTLGDYSRTLNFPYRIQRAAGASPFEALIGQTAMYANPAGYAQIASNLMNPEFRQKISNVKSWPDVWDGNAIFDQDAVSRLDEVYSPGQKAVAVGLLEGQNFQEIIQQYGEPDVELLQTIDSVMDGTFDKTILEDYKRAQVSPGRDIARLLDERFSAPGISEKDPAFTALSGSIDAAYQILIDPLTYLSFGTGNLATKGGRAFEKLLKGDSTDVKNYFQDATNKKYWDEGGKLLQRLADARALPGREGLAEAAKVRNEIASGFFKAQSNAGQLDLLIRSGVRDAATAEEFFMIPTNLNRLILGRVDGVQWFKETAPTAKISSSIAASARNAVGRLFNGQIDPDKTTINGLIDEILKASDEEITSSPLMPVINNIINGQKRLTRRIATYTADHPAPLNIIVGTGKDPATGIPYATKTEKQVNAFYRVLLDSDIYARIATEYFMKLSLGERIRFWEGSNVALFYKMGLHQSENGRELIRAWRSNYSDVTGDPRKFTAVQIAQETATIAPTPFIKMAQEAQKNVKLVGTNGNPLRKFFGGITNSRLAKEYTDSWVVLTLFPSLGIRSAIDEGFFGSLTTPYEIMSVLASGRADKIENILAGMSRNEASFGPLKTKILSILNKTPSQRVEALSRAFDDEELVDAVINNFNKNSIRARLTPDDVTYVKALLRNPDFRSPVPEFSFGRSLLVSNIDVSVPNQVMLRDEFMKSADELGMTRAAYRQLVDMYDSLSPMQIGIAQLDNTRFRFANKGNTRTIEIDGVKYFIDPASVFLRRNALRPGTGDALAAQEDILKSIGVDLVDGSFNVTKPKLLEEFLSTSVLADARRQAGKSDLQIALERVQLILDDLYVNFHGGRDQYNEKLYQYIVNTSKETGKSYSKVIEELKLDQYVDLLKYTDPVSNKEAFNTYSSAIADEIRVSLMPRTFDPSPENQWTRIKNGAMDMMDRTLKDLFRAPAVQAWGTFFFKKMSKSRQEYVEQLISNGIKSNVANRIAEDRYAKMANDLAIDRVLKYVDNPFVRSNLSYDLRVFSRFYRATEDFLRRMYRMSTDAPVRALVRMRLLAIAVEDMGFVHQNQDGEYYVIVPFDNVIISATNQVAKSLVGEENYAEIPQFTELTLKLNTINPSFQAEAGMPLFGPVVGTVAVRTVKTILGKVAGPEGEVAALDLDRYLLGELVGSQRPLFWDTKQNKPGLLVPGGLTKLYNAFIPPWFFSSDENRAVRDVNSTQSALQALAAGGNIPSDLQERRLRGDISSRELNEYLKMVRMAAHNINTFKTLVSFAGISLGQQQTLDMPTSLKEVGYVSPNQLYGDILEGILSLPPDQVPDDPQAVALATFIADNPNRLAYTVSKNESSEILLANTKEANEWYIRNKKFVNNYRLPDQRFAGGAALVFAPHMGEFDPEALMWQRAMGLEENKDLEAFLDDVLAVGVKQYLFDLQDKLKEDLSKTTDPSERAFLQSQNAITVKSLKQAYPLVETMFTTDFTRSKEYQMLRQMEQIVGDSEAPITEQQRKIHGSIVSSINRYIEYTQIPPGDRNSIYQENKQAIKQRIVDELDKLRPGDSSMEAAYRAIYLPVLNNISRETYLTVPRK